MNPWLSALIIAGSLVLSAVAGRYVVQGTLWLASRSSDAGRGSRTAGTTPLVDAPPSAPADAPPDAEPVTPARAAPPPDQPGNLRGGTWIGVLERLAVTAALLAGYPAGIAFVIAVKGLGRYPELREHPGSSERFVIGTLASLVWATGWGLLGAALLGTRVLGV